MWDEKRRVLFDIFNFTKWTYPTYRSNSVTHWKNLPVEQLMIQLMIMMISEENLLSKKGGRVYRDRAEGGAGGGALAPPLFCKNKNELPKK